MVRGQEKFRRLLSRVGRQTAKRRRARARGLGMQAQVDAVEAFVRFHDGRICASFEETESGRSANDRPELDKALARTQSIEGNTINRQT